MSISTTTHDLADRGDQVQARFANGAQAEADALVGADGIHSAVRKVLFGPEEPRFTGCVAYRGLVRPSGSPTWSWR